jgi:hypothetical protein
MLHRKYGLLRPNTNPSRSCIVTLVMIAPAGIPLTRPGELVLNSQGLCDFAISDLNEGR